MVLETSANSNNGQRTLKARQKWRRWWTVTDMPHWPGRLEITRFALDSDVPTIAESLDSRGAFSAPLICFSFRCSSSSRLGLAWWGVSLLAQKRQWAHFLISLAQLSLNTSMLACTVKSQDGQGHPSLRSSSLKFHLSRSFRRFCMRPEVTREGTT